MQEKRRLRKERKASGFSRQRVAEGGAAPADVSYPRASANRDPRPNVVLIVTDDLRADDLWALPAVQELLVAQGTLFTNFITTAPGCAPARASIFRGQYPHNHGVVRGSGPLGGFGRFREMGNEASTLATWLKDAGYTTALIGKYINAYPIDAAPNHIPPGWDEWHAAMGGGFYGFELNEGGEIVRYRKRDHAYQTDVLAEKTAAFVARIALTDAPFFLYIAPRAPHWPATPAPRHENLFAGQQAPRPPSFDAADVAQKPLWLQQAPPLEQSQIDEIDTSFRDRLESMQAVDELIAELVKGLRETGLLDQTYIILTADHGWHMGEHRIVGGKGTPYEEAVRIPFVVRGPGISPGETAALASTIDMAPTIAEWAGASVPEFVDGRSLAPVLRGPIADWRGGVLIEHYHGRPDRTDGPPAFQAMRGEDWLYVEYSDGWRERYDLAADPYELRNRAAESDAATMARLHAALADLSACAGARCRAAEDAARALAGAGEGSEA